MEIYLLKSVGCLLLLMVFYKLFLEQTSMHNLKRGYLLMTAIAPLTIPFVTFTSYVEASALPEITATAATPESMSALEFPFTIEQLLWTVYFVGLTIFGFRFMWRLKNMFRRIRKNPKQRYNNIFKVFLQQDINPHTFLSYIFLNNKAYEEKQIPEIVLEHEMVHARERHSLDILILEVIKVIFWFNPLFILLGKSMKLNHEFLADQGVLAGGVPTPTYQETILAYSSHAGTPQMAHSINYSSLKKRFTVMKTKSSRTAIWLRSLMLLPLLAIMLFSFSSRETIEIPLEEKVEQTFQQTSASREEMKEYNKLARKYNAMKKGEREYKLKELERMKYIFNKMSDKQRADAEPFPEIVPPPPPPPPKPGEAPKLAANKVASKVVGSIPPPPPPPPAENFDDLLKKGDKFYLNGKEISRKQVKALEKEQKKLKTIHVVRENNGQTAVYFEN